MNELVPVTYARTAWNTLYGTELEYHDSLITPEQAERINEHFDIEVVGGVHGIVAYDAQGRQMLDAEDRLKLPTQKEYEAAGQVVEGLRPGRDLLFVEEYGMTESRRYAQLEDSVRTARKLESGTSMFGLIFSSMATGLMDELKRDTEQMRGHYQISAWDYAARKAALEGVSVISADHDAYDAHVLLQQRGMTASELMRSARTNPDDAALMERVHRAREKQARNTVKDWLVANLPPEGTPAPAPEERRRVVLLYGDYHREELVKAFAELGLHAVEEQLPQSSIQERQNEQVAVLFSQALMALAQNVGNLIASGIDGPASTTQNEPKPSLQAPAKNSLAAGVVARREHYTAQRTTAPFSGRLSRGLGSTYRSPSGQTPSQPKESSEQ